MRQKPYSVTTDRTGLGWFYRFRWRLAYMATFVTGSASRQGTIDPMVQLRAGRAARLIAAYQELGQEPPAEAVSIAQRAGRSPGRG